MIYSRVIKLVHLFPIITIDINFYNGKLRTRLSQSSIATTA